MGQSYVPENLAAKCPALASQHNIALGRWRPWPGAEREALRGRREGQGLCAGRLTPPRHPPLPDEDMGAPKMHV